jgi:hypothetical protein
MKTQQKATYPLSPSDVARFITLTLYYNIIPVVKF